MQGIGGTSCTEIFGATVYVGCLGCFPPLCCVVLWPAPSAPLALVAIVHQPQAVAAGAGASLFWGGVRGAL